MQMNFTAYWNKGRAGGTINGLDDEFLAAITIDLGDLYYYVKREENITPQMLKNQINGDFTASLYPAILTFTLQNLTYGFDCY